MTESLIRQYGSWEGVVDHIYRQVSAKNSVNEKKFKEWMMAQYSLSPSGYERGTFGDPAYYLHLFKIHEKMTSGENQHHMILVAGKIGKGKSTLALQMAGILDPNFNMERVCYTPYHFFKCIAKSTPGQAIVIDEGGNFFKSRNSMTKIGKDLGQAFQLIRDLQQIIIICYDEPEKLDKELIDKFDSMFLKVYRPKSRGADKFKHYIAFNSASLGAVKPELKKKIPVMDNKILKHATWQGTNTFEIPVIEDLNAVKYHEEKRKYLKDHMLALAEKYKEDGEVKEEEKDPLEVSELPRVDAKTGEDVRLANKWYMIEEAAKLLGVSRYTLGLWAKHGKLRAVKLGGRYRFRHYDLVNLPSEVPPSRIRVSGTAYNLNNATALPPKREKSKSEDKEWV